MHSDATANRVLVKGEPVPAPPGRADDFVWPLGSDGKNVPPVASAPGTAPAAAPAANAVARTEPPAAAGKPSEEPKRGAAAKTSQTTVAKPRLERPVETKPRPPQSDVPRPPAVDPAVRRLLRLAAVKAAQRGSVVDPIRNLSTACAAWRPSRIAHTTSDWPRRMSPAANTLGTEVT